MDGWLDSTFRLIQLVFIYGVRVQSYYVIDHGRNSALLEFRAMTNIKEMLIRKDSQIKDLILPTIFRELNEIGTNNGITNSYKRLVAVEDIGLQYECLARFCAEEGITNMEISNMNVTYEEDNHTKKLLGDNLDRFETNFGVYYKLTLLND